MPKKTMLISIFVLIVGILIFLNLGKMLNAESAPVKSDMIVCLGGEEVRRIEKAVSLYRDGYATKKILMVTGDGRTDNEIKFNKKEGRLLYIEKNKIDCDLEYVPQMKHTKDEIYYIKKFMLNKNLKSTIIVSDPPHLRRIKLLLSLLTVDGDSGLSFHLVASDLDDWEDSTYYKKEFSRKYAFKESAFWAYSLFNYGFLSVFGLDDDFEHFVRKSKVGRKMHSLFMGFLPK